MVLEIKEKNEIIKVLGHITSQNIPIVKTHIAEILEITNKMKIHSEKISNIDSILLKSLENFSYKVIFKNKALLHFKYKKPQSYQ